MVHANNMGDYVGAIRPKKRTYYTKCPRCGGRKMSASKVCHTCQMEQEREADLWGKENWPGILRRHRLFEFALRAGWTIEELWPLARAGTFPTRAQIMRREVAGYRVGRPEGRI